MMTRTLFLFGALALAGCAMDAEGAKMAEGDRGNDAGASGGAQCAAANDCPPGYYCNEFHRCTPLKGGDGGVTGDGALPPEVEAQQDPPAAGKRYVYVAVPRQNMVVKIDSQTLKVRSVKVGQDPGALRTLKGQDVAVLLNRKSATATVLRSRADGGDDLVTINTAPNLNNLALAPDGSFGVAFFDVSRATGELTGKQSSFQDVTLLRLTKGKEAAVNLTVGFRPTGVQFASDSSRAFVVTEHSVSVIDPTKVTKPAILPSVALLKDPLAEPKPDEVLITPDGKLALARQTGVKGIRAVDLTTRAITDVALSGEATDLDLTAGGKVAVVVMRAAAEVALLDIPADLTDPSGIDTLATGKYTAGQATLTKDGKRAFLFTNATSQEVLLMADLDSRKLSVHPLQKGVRTVYAAPDGKRALVLHNKVAGAPSKSDGLETYIDKSHGYSLLDVGLGFAKLQLTTTDPGQVAFAADSSAAYVTLSDSKLKVQAVEAMDLSSFLINSVALGSPPVGLGVIAATKQVYVPQSHHLGRVTFIDIKTHQTRTVTGFELNSQVIE